MRSRAPSLERIEAVCEALDHPERSLTAIHVTGTNGKTSTASIATSLLVARGLSVATYTSAHLQTVRERIALSGDPIDESGFGEVFEHLRPFVDMAEKKLGERLTYFEVLTAMFFLWAAEAPVDVCVIEVGLGGRWDATNVISAPVSVITNIGLDHVALLGDKREDIALEKAGVIKPDSVAVTGERSPAVLDVIERRAGEVGAEVLAAGRDFRLVDDKVALGGRFLSVQTREGDYDGVFLPLHGAHQALNAALALQAVLRLAPSHLPDRDTVAQGLGEVHVPGRMEPVPLTQVDAPTLLLDVAHNADGMSALVSALVETFAFARVIFVIGVLADKDLAGMLEELTRVPCTVIATPAPSSRSVPPETLKVAADEMGLECSVAQTVGHAVTAALSTARPDDLICVTGSHYVVGEARSLLVG